VNGTTYFKMQPARSRNIARLIISRCNAVVKQQYRDSRGAFFTAKNSKGKSFLDMMRKTIKTQNAKQFRVSKGRFASRRKKERAAQLCNDEVAITLPAAGDYAPLRTKTLNKVHRSKGNPMITIWLPCTTEVIDHVTRLAKLHIEKEDEDVDDVEVDDEPDASSDHESDDVVDALGTEDGNNSEDREGGNELDDDNTTPETHEGEGDDGHDNNANTHDANDDRSTRMSAYPIFKAFHA
jgi:hypothetical protein